MIEILFKAGSSLELRLDLMDDAGRTSFIQALMTKNMKAMRSLLALGLDPNIADVDGKTPLMYAIEHNNLKIMRLLLACGADPNVADAQNKSPLMYAVFYAGIDGVAPVIDSLIAFGAQVNSANAQGRTPLMYAAEHADRPGALETMIALLKSGARVNRIDTDGRTALMDAAISGHCAAIHLLLDVGANPQTANVLGQPLLMYVVAIQNHQPNMEQHHQAEIKAMIGRLMQAGVRLNDQDTHGKSAFIHAILAGNTTAIQLLMDAQAILHYADPTLPPALERMDRLDDPEPQVTTTLILNIKVYVMIQDWLKQCHKGLGILKIVSEMPPSLQNLLKAQDQGHYRTDFSIGFRFSLAKPLCFSEAALKETKKGESLPGNDIHLPTEVLSIISSNILAQHIVASVAEGLPTEILGDIAGIFDQKTQEHLVIQTAIPVPTPMTATLGPEIVVVAPTVGTPAAIPNPPMLHAALLTAQQQQLFMPAAVLEELSDAEDAAAPLNPW